MISRSLVLVLALFGLGMAKQLCEVDSDCDKLGTLKCMKTACKWGVCGCPRYQAMRWLGSDMMFKCVPMKKVGESCSLNDETGVCGGDNTVCENGKCRCDSIVKVPIWGGEKCAAQNAAGVLVPGETCGTGASSGYGTCGSCGAPTNHGILSADVLGCDECDSGHMEIFNAWGLQNYRGRKLPACRQSMLGDLCLKDSDCTRGGMVSYANGYVSGGATGNMKCVDNKCKCDDVDPAKTVPNIQSGACDKPLSHGTVCSGPGFTPGDGTCDVTKFLMCGDFCEWDYDGSTDAKCACQPGYKTSGSTCTAREPGDTCMGDLSCANHKYPAGTCDNGSCVNAVARLAVSLLALLLPVLASMKMAL